MFLQIRDRVRDRETRGPIIGPTGSGSGGFNPAPNEREGERKTKLRENEKDIAQRAAEK